MFLHLLVQGSSLFLRFIDSHQWGLVCLIPSSFSLICVNELALLKENDICHLSETFSDVTTKILTLGIDNDDIENLDIRDGKVLLKTKTLRELESVLDEGEEVGTILVDSHFLTSPKEELRTILGLTSLTTKIVLQYYADDELDLDSLRQLGIDLLEAPLTSDGWQALTEGH